MHIPQNQQNLHNKDDKVVTEVTKELDSFKQRFFQLIDKAQVKIEHPEAQRKLVHKDDDYQSRLFDIEYEILSDLIKNYKELVNRYVVDLVLFEWPKLLLDKNEPETLSKLYMVTFAKLQEIQKRLCQIIPPILSHLDDEDCALDYDYTKDNEKDMEELHSMMFGGSLFKPIPTFEQKLATFEREFLHY